MPTKSRGICITCDNGSFCSFRLNRGVIAIQCEEFELKEVARTTPSIPASSESSAREQINLNGAVLCCDCENSRTCCLSSTPGGVWHCGEYV